MSITGSLYTYTLYTYIHINYILYSIYLTCGVKYLLCALLDGRVGAEQNHGVQIALNAYIHIVQVCDI